MNIGFTSYVTGTQATFQGVVNLSAYLSTPLSAAFAASVTLDVAANNDFVIGVLTGNISISFSNPAAGRQGTMVVKQDNTGGRTVTINAPATYTLVRDVNNSDLVAATAANAITEYPYGMFTVGGINYLRISKILWV